MRFRFRPDAMNVITEVGKRWFLLGLVAVIVLAKIAPHLGAKGGRLNVDFVFVKEGIIWRQ